MSKALMLRTCEQDMTSYDGFVWPESGPVEAPNWSPEPVCGGGLHGLLWGEGDGGLLNWKDDARWLVVEIEEAEAVEINGKVKVPRGVVVFCGDRRGATDYLLAHGGQGRAIVGATVTSGNRGTATAGYGGTLVIRWFDGDRYRLAVAYVGEDGIKPNTPYRLDDKGNFVEVGS